MIEMKLYGSEKMLIFLLGLFIGGMVGVVVMCLLQVHRDAPENMEVTQPDFEKSGAVGVDNTTKKA